jgi:hypothetical protein
MTPVLPRVPLTGLTIPARGCRSVSFSVVQVNSFAFQVRRTKVTPARIVATETLFRVPVAARARPVIVRGR